VIGALEARLVFGRPTRIRPLAPGPHAGRYAVASHSIARADGATLEGWSARPLDGPTEGVLLYFGGRNENVAWAADMASFNRGFAVYAFNYRGFGASTGRSSEQRAKRDARAIHDFVARRESMSRVAVAGRSLGTALALWLARETQPDRLVLMSPFESVPDVVRTRPLGWAVAGLMTQRFACAGPAAGFAGEALVLLAATDRSIAHEQSLRLCARLPKRPTVQIIDGSTHRSLPRSPGAQAAIAAFLGRPAQGASTLIPRSA